MGGATVSCPIQDRNFKHQSADCPLRLADLKFCLVRRLAADSTKQWFGASATGACHSMVPSKIARFVLWVSGLVFIGFGVAFFLAPVLMSDQVQIRLLTESARTGVRAVYGGLQIGFGAFCVFCALSHSRAIPGLVGIAFTLGGMACARVAGMVIDGSPEPIIFGLLAGEASGALLALVVLARERRRATQYS